MRFSVHTGAGWSFVAGSKADAEKNALALREFLD